MKQSYDKKKFKSSSTESKRGDKKSMEEMRKPKFKRNKKRDKKTDVEEENFKEVAVKDGFKPYQQKTFEDAGYSSGDEVKATRKMVRQQNRKNKKPGAFQSMGLSHAVFKGIARTGYSKPTPIQRKTIPLIIDGKDVVAMARTGSGKTAAFLIPLFERLKTHQPDGVRALMLAPTRELALQTLKFTKELGKFTGLRAAVVLGGDSMEEQYAAMHQNPDIIIATPGRLMHVIVEMDMKLHTIEYVVFDEADRLFEMGFHEQLTEILRRLPESRQTLLFSATLPKLLVDFARAGLHDPTLVRLDVESKISENLKMTFLSCRSNDKVATLLHLLKQIIHDKQQTVIFVATKHHVDYLNLVLKEAGLSCSYSYSDLDPTARKINVAKFRNKKTMILLVTDLAARGIDIPMLDNVINFNFPAKSKLFVHRVGRVARAGNCGIAYSLVSPDEMPYVLDLHMFLGREMKLTKMGVKTEDEDGLLGAVPQDIIDDEEENLLLMHSKTDIGSALKVSENAMKNYIKSREQPSSESVKRIKEIMKSSFGNHPIYGIEDNSLEQEKLAFLQNMKSYKPVTTVFEIQKTSKSNDSHYAMQRKRNLHGNVINRQLLHKQCKIQAEVENRVPNETQEMSTDADISETFSKVILPAKFDLDQKKKMKKKVKKVDTENYLHYRPSDYQSEKGYSMGTSFEKEANIAGLDIAPDDHTTQDKIKTAKKWDRKKKKFVGVSGDQPKRVKTESGAWVKATYKTDSYKRWLEKQNMPSNNDDGHSDEDDEFNKPATQEQKEGRLQVFGGGRKLHGRFYHNKNQDEDKGKKPRNRLYGLGLKKKETILKARREREKKGKFGKGKMASKGGRFGNKGRGK